MLTHVNTFRIGCDPEFAVLDSHGKLINVEEHDEGSLYDGEQVGADHGGEVVELRPDPAYTVSELLKNIKGLLDSRSLTPFKKYRWRGGAAVPTTNEWVGGQHQPLGGHIHLELPYEGNHGIPQKVFKERIEACDMIVRRLEEFDILPKRECDLRRRTGYGQFGQTDSVSSDDDDYSSYSDNSTFVRTEYRTPCSWLFHPRVAFITLTGIKLAATNSKLALNTLVGNSIETKWRNFVRFYRAFRMVDSDAELVCRRYLNSVKVTALEKIKADPTKDFKKKWSRFDA